MLGVFVLALAVRHGADDTKLEQFDVETSPTLKPNAYAEVYMHMKSDWLSKPNLNSHPLLSVVNEIMPNSAKQLLSTRPACGGSLASSRVFEV